MQTPKTTTPKKHHNYRHFWLKHLKYSVFSSSTLLTKVTTSAALISLQWLIEDSHLYELSGHICARCTSA